MHATLAKFMYPDLLVKDHKHWALLIRAKHVTLGSMVIVAKPDVDSLGALHAEAWSEFGVICNEAEATLKHAFGAEKFNYTALMMADPHVHFHLIPRYSKPVEFNGKQYIDNEWPVLSKLHDPEVPATELALIQQKLIDTIKSHE